MSLDQKAAQMVLRARQIERAVHDPGPWSITVGWDKGEMNIPARRVVGEDHVTFYAVVPLFEQQNLSGLDYILAELSCGSELVAMKPLEPVNDFAEISWEFLVIDPEQVAA